MSTTSVAQNAEVENAQDANISAIRATKRKLDDAFQSLDNAVTSQTVQPQRPSPPKKINVNRTLYSTLAKYGIRSKPAESKETSVANSGLPSSISVPHLKAILTRAATRSKSALSFGLSGTPPELPPTAEYRPSSIPAFLSRLSTFKLSTYSQKPSAVDAVAAAKAGWINEGKDRLVCGLCKSSWVVIGTKGMSRDAANALLEKQRNSLVQQHKEGCPWKVRQCDSNIYRIPLHTPSNMVRDLKSNATELEPVLKHVEIKHPLTPTQMKSLRATIRSYELSFPATTEDAGPGGTDTNNEDTNPFTDESSPGPSDAAIVTSLLGWSIAPPAPPETTRRISSSRASSIAPRTPPYSRASSVRPSTPAPVAATAPPGGPKATESISSRPKFPSLLSRATSTSFSFRMPLSSASATSSSAVKRENTLLHCKLCQRRVGLWAFTDLPTSTTEPLSASRSGSPAPSAAPLSASRSGSPAPSAAPSEDPDTSMADVSMADVSMDTSVDNATLPRFSFFPGSISAPIPRRAASTAQAAKAFDLLKEHRSYCPYVVKSTTVPSLPQAPSSASIDNTSNDNTATSPTNNGQNSGSALEGWRAVLTVILRYGLGQQYRLGLNYTRPEEDLETSMEVDNVNFMVDSVKSRGGKDLLQYVKGLLG